MNKIFVLCLLLTACSAQVEQPAPTPTKSTQEPGYDYYPNSNIPDPSNCPPPLTFTIVKDGLAKQVTFEAPCLGPVYDNGRGGDPPFSQPNLPWKEDNINELINKPLINNPVSIPQVSTNRG